MVRSEEVNIALKLATLFAQHVFNRSWLCDYTAYFHADGHFVMCVLMECVYDLLRPDDSRAVCKRQPSPPGGPHA